MAERSEGVSSGRVIVNLPTWTDPSHVQQLVGVKSPLSDDLEEFRGVPFGMIERRWEHSSLRTSLPQDVFDATKNGPICPQPSTARNSEYYQAYLPFPDLAQSEFECLNLIVVRPSEAALSRTGRDAKTKLPVLVYIHGGVGSGAGSDPFNDPSRLVLRSVEIGSPIIAVNLNYRVGVFGGLGSADILKSQGPSDVRGLNFGIYDQKVGMTWVARNISQFGGDPDQITLCGTSAGGSCAYAHVLDASSPSSGAPLFQRAYVKSAPLLTILPTSLAEAEASWDRLCQHWDVKPESDGAEKLELLRRIPTAAMLESSISANVSMLPSIADGITRTEETVSFPPVDPQREVGQGFDEPIQVMIGVMDVESAGHAQTDVDLAKLERGIAESFTTKGLASEIMQAYGLVAGRKQSDLKAALERLHSDALYDLGIYRARKLLAAQRRAKYGAVTSVQPYHVDFCNPFPGPKFGCAHHVVDVIYMFEAFHDALEDCDNGGSQTYGEAAASHRVNVKGKHEARVPPPSVGDFLRSHLELAKKFQDFVLGFISGRPVVRAGDGEVIVWGRDGSLRVESLASARWMDRNGRLQLLEREASSVLKLLRCI